MEHNQTDLQPDSDNNDVNFLLVMFLYVLLAFKDMLNLSSDVTVYINLLIAVMLFIINFDKLYDTCLKWYLRTASFVAKVKAKFKKD